MNNQHSNTSILENVDNDKFEIKQENDSVSNCYDMEKDIKSDQEVDSNFSDCLNDAVTNKYDPVMSGKINFNQKGPFICDTCGKNFKNKSNFIIHYRIHTKYRPFICFICSKGFYSKGELKKHLLVHSNAEKKFKCEFCNKSFKHKRSKAVHFRKHTENKPYVSDFCEKSSSTSTNFKTHVVSHSNEQINETIKEERINEQICIKCNENYRGTSINKHIAKCKGPRGTDPVYKCAVCNKAWKTKYSLKSHTKSHSNPKSYNYIYTVHENINLS